MGLNGGSSTGHYKHQGVQNGYAIGYGETEFYNGQIHNPSHGMIKPQKAYEMAETWEDESYAQSYGSHKSQNGPVMTKTQVHGPAGNGYGTAQMQSYGYSHNSSPRKHEGRVHGYGGSTPAARYQKNGGGMGRGFGTHGNYEVAEAYGYAGEYKNNGMTHSHETNGYGEYANNGMGRRHETHGYGEYANNGMAAARSQAHIRGKQSGHGNGFVKAQAYSPAKNMGYQYNEAEARDYSETHFSNESQYYGGAGGYHGGNNYKAKGLIRNNSGNNSGSDSESDHDDVWTSKAL